MRVIRYIAPPAFAGKKLYSFLKGGAHLSSRLIRSLKQSENGLLVNGVHARTVDLLRAGDVITVTIPDDTRSAVPGETLPQVLFEDDDLLIVNKSALLPIHESHNHQGDTLANCVALHLQQQGKTAVFRAVGRLDKGTSGLVVCALNSHAASCLAGKIQKTYLAVAEGVFTGSGTIDAPIFRPDPMKTLRTVDPRGDRAVTHWTALESDGRLTLLEIRLETGRTHQIRVHFASLGAPLFGDRMYGTPQEALPHQALHCARVEFCHPITGARVDVQAPPPWDFHALCAAAAAADAEKK
ncbi:MAG: RluA family pseudouridine synthase [Clostridia bacterium]|nr:RluA family pseudouridine synthase [Clostridia bacterium]